MLVAATVIANIAGVETYPTPFRIDVGLAATATAPMTIATFMASGKSQMIKRTCICAGLAALTLLLFVLHESFPSLGSSS
jgi:hypothetical protein